MALLLRAGGGVRLGQLRDDAGGDFLEGVSLGRIDRALAVQRPAGPVDHPAAAVDDDVAMDVLLQKLYRAGVPPEVEVQFVGVDAARERIDDLDRSGLIDRVVVVVARARTMPPGKMAMEKPAASRSVKTRAKRNSTA